MALFWVEFEGLLSMGSVGCSTGMMPGGDGWVLVGPAVLKTVARRAERLGCVRFTYVSAIPFYLRRYLPALISGLTLTAAQLEVVL